VLHLRIDWERWARQWIWFGYQCVNVIDSKGNWHQSFYWSRRLVPIKKRDWPIEEYVTDEEQCREGFSVYTQVIK